MELKFFFFFNSAESSKDSAFLCRMARRMAECEDGRNEERCMIPWEKTSLLSPPPHQTPNVIDAGGVKWPSRPRLSRPINQWWCLSRVFPSSTAENDGDDVNNRHSTWSEPRNTFGIDRIRIALTCQARVPRRKKCGSSKRYGSSKSPTKFQCQGGVFFFFFFFFFFVRRFNAVFTDETFCSGFESQKLWRGESERGSKTPREAANFLTALPELAATNVLTDLEIHWRK